VEKSLLAFVYAFFVFLCPCVWINCENDVVALPRDVRRTGEVAEGL